MGVSKRLIGAGATASGALTPSENFKVVTYTGNSSTQSITGVGFQPDFVWIKERSQAENHNWIDSTRGTSKILSSNLTGAEFTSTRFTSFDTDGFTLANNNETNDNGVTYVAWCWKANGGTTESNTDGSITSTVQANTDAGFSIVKYTGNNTANATIGHGLSSTPQLIISKNLDNGSAYWATYHHSIGITRKFYLNDTSTGDTVSGGWLDVSSTLITLKQTNANNINENGSDFINYCFTEVDSFSKFGSYTGTGGNLIVETGFEPAFLMIKRTDAATYDWYILDNKRNPVDYRNTILRANATTADQTVTNGDIDVKFLSNGFAFDDIPTSSGGFNASGGTYIYMAFAADPDTEAPTLADSFAVETYTGTGSAQSITGFGFKPNLLYIKRRTGASGPNMTNSILGIDYYMFTDSTSNFGSDVNHLGSFDDDGFTTAGGGSAVNGSGEDYVVWAFKADDNEPTINTEGSIDSIVSANANAGFSIVKYTGNGNSSQTVGHGLSAAPELIIAKPFITSSWVVYTATTGTNKIFELNSDAAEQTISNYWGTSSPSATTFGVAPSNSNNNSTGNAIIAYCFHSVSGYSKIGTYTGSGSSGNAQNIGFQPDFVMIKSRAQYNWNIYDSKRPSGSITGRYMLIANSNGSEITSSVVHIDLTSTGFSFPNAYDGTNKSGQDYVYMAFKMNKTPYPLAGNMSFLVIAGGGSGGARDAGPGGAGGLRTSYGSTSGGGAASENDITLAAGTYTITIGSGGAKVVEVTSVSPGNSGTDSSIAATGLTTITSNGGGGGGTSTQAASSGGSGGGGTAGQQPGSGTSGQGFAGGYGTGSYTSGGGGGASQAGNTPPSNENGGDGGDGLAVEITGSSVTYAGGGGGSGDTSSGSGGTGGGGAGQSNASLDATSGTANTGGGGGSHRQNLGTSGAGGSGVVILRLLTSEYSGTTTGSPTVTTDGDYTILKYTGSGTYVHS